MYWICVACTGLYACCTVIHSLHQSPSGNLGCLLIMCCSCEITWRRTSEEVEEAGVWSPSIHQINMLITRRGLGQDHMHCHFAWRNVKSFYCISWWDFVLSLHSEESPPWKDCEWIENRLLYIHYYMPLLSGYVRDHAASPRISTTLKGSNRSLLIPSKPQHQSCYHSASSGTLLAYHYILYLYMETTLIGE